MRMMPTNRVVQFTLDRVAERLSKPTDRRDFLSLFLKAKLDHPEVVSDRQVISYSLTNVFAGSDTTAISLRSVFYYLLKNYDILKKVVQEIDEVVRDRDCCQHPISFAESNRMAYLQAVLKEAMRMHPAVGLLLERSVPKDGCIIAGTWLPGGTIVGISPWVMHRDRQVFGEDADVFRPERWLEADSDRLKMMDRSFMAVGVHLTLLWLAHCLTRLSSVLGHALA